MQINTSIPPWPSYKCKNETLSNTWTCVNKPYNQSYLVLSVTLTHLTVQYNQHSSLGYCVSLPMIPIFTAHPHFPHLTLDQHQPYSYLVNCTLLLTLLCTHTCHMMSLPSPVTPQVTFAYPWVTDKCTKRHCPTLWVTNILPLCDPNTCPKVMSNPPSSDKVLPLRHQTPTLK